MKKLNDVADILIELVARGGGNETLDPLYDLIADQPGSTNFTAEQGRDALLVNVIKLAGSYLLIASDQLAYSASCAATCMACKPCGSRGGAVPCAAGMSVLAELARPCGRRQ